MQSASSAVAPDLEGACRRWGTRTALTTTDRDITYDELGEAVRSTAAAYRALGIGGGDRVLCVLRDGPQVLVAAHAAWAVGAVHVGVSPDLTATELDHLRGRLRPAAAVVPAAGEDDGPEGRGDALAARGWEPPVELDGAGRATGALAMVAGLSLGEAAGDRTRPPDPSEAEWRRREGPAGRSPVGGSPAGDRTRPPGHLPAVLFLTSGTMGTPKAALDTGEALWAKVRYFADHCAPRPEDVHLMYLPMNHAFGLKLSLLALLSGGRLVLQRRFSPGGALQAVESEQVSILPATPTHLTLLLDRLEEAPRRTDSLRWVLSAAAPLPGPLVERARAVLGVRFMSVYGCSEGFLVTSTDYDDIRAGATGRVGARSAVFRGPPGSAPDGTVWVERPEGGALPDGESGEIVYGAKVPVRYWGEPDAATGGRYRSGDLGRIDELGRLHVLGRLKDLVNRGGIKVSPLEVELALARHPGVADAAVVPTPDRVLGEAICACVVPSGPRPSLEEVRTFLGSTLARHKLPDELCCLERLPRSPVGKLDRHALAEVAVRGSVPRERLRPA